MPWQVGQRIQFWGGARNGWVSAEIISVSVRGAPTVIDPLTGKRRTFHVERRTPFNGEWDR